jgi:hypothetical protein
LDQLVDFPAEDLFGLILSLVRRITPLICLDSSGLVMVIMATSRGRGKLSQTLSVIGDMDTGMANAASRDF